MLFDEPVLFVRGLTIYRDFSNANLYYFLPPETPRIARSAENSSRYALRLVLYRPDPNVPPPEGMENGGGFLNLDADLHVPEAVLEEVTQEIQRRFGGQASLVPAPFLNGSVDLVLLGTTRDDENAPFVRKIAGSTVPSLYGTQRATFSLVLDRDGAAVMESVIRRGGDTMAAAIYHLTYAGIGPAYNLKITVDYEKVYEHLDLRLRAGITAGGGGSSFVAKAGFHMLMEELRERRAVLVEETDPVPGENGRTPTDQARIDEIIGNLMGSKWFKPTLASAAQMTEVAAAAAAAPGGSSGGGATTPAPGSGTTTSSPTVGQHTNAQWQEESRNPPQLPSGRGVEAFQPATSGTRETLTVQGSGASVKAGADASSLQSVAMDGNRVQIDVPAGATRHVEIKWAAVPAGAPGPRPAATWNQDSVEGPAEGRGVQPFQPAATGSNEALVIRGAGATAKAGPTPAALTSASVTGDRLTVDVPPGETRHIEITWPASSAVTERFFLFFDYERPHDTPADVQSYSSRSPALTEGPPAGEGARFLPESRGASSTRRGPNALDDWLTTVPAGTSLTMDAHASYEHDPANPNDPAKAASNQRLSERRLAVARALLNNRVPVSRATAHGHTVSKAERDNPALPANERIPTVSGDGAQANTRGGKPQHRVVVFSYERPGQPQTILKGQLRRATAPSTGQPQPESTLIGRLTRAAGGGDGRPSGGGTTTVQATFEVNLEMIEREERVIATYELSTRKARTQEIHPQGQLMLEVIDPSEYIVEADGALEFFQWLEINGSTTAQWELEGIDSIQLQIRYAPRVDGFGRTGEMFLTKDNPTGNFKTGVLGADENDDRSATLYSYEYRVTVHYLPDVALGDQSGAVTSVGVAGADPEGWIRSTERNLVIHPRDVTPAITVTITSGIMRFDLLDRVQLVLLYGPYRQNLTLSQERRDHRLVIRPEAGLEQELLRTEGTLFYKDGAQVPLPAQSWKPQELIIINEPRENVLRVQAILADPANEYQKVHLRLRYEHGNRLVEEDRELAAHAQMEEWAVRLEDPSNRDWKYQATLIKRSGDIDTIDWTEGKGGQLILGVRAVDVIPVRVTWVVPPSGELLAVKIDLRYVDDPNGVTWNHSELIRGQHPGEFTWPVAIADPKKRTYEYRVTEFFRAGAKEGPWIPSSEKSLVLLPSA